MMTSPPIFLQGDKVYYTGEKFKDRLNGKPGWIHAQVNGNPYGFVVEFPDTRNAKDPKDTDDYVMPYTVLSKWRPEHVKEKEKEKDKKQEGPEVQPRRRKRGQEESE